MPIQVRCACGAGYRVPDKWAGRKARCQRCRAAIAIPARVAPKDADDFEVVDDGFEVVSDAKSAPVRPKADDSAEAADPPAPRQRKKRPPLDPKVRRLIKEDLEAERRHRRGQLKRGWAYSASGVSLILFGIGLIRVCVAYQADPAGEGPLPELVHFFYKFGGAWTPGIVAIVAGLVPLTLGILNFLGIGILVVAWEDDNDDRVLIVTR